MSKEHFPSSLTNLEGPITTTIVRNLTCLFPPNTPLANASWDLNPR